MKGPGEDEMHKPWADQKTRGHSPCIFAISGDKNTGKTTLMERLITRFTALGYRVASIKHDGHDFEPDVPGTDSWRHRQAGAYGTAVYSGSRFLLTKEQTGINEKDLTRAFPEADLILIEGLKDSNYPKYVCSYPHSTPDENAAAAMILRAMGRETGA